MSQCSQLFVHMQDRGPITPLEAFRLYGILATHSRMAELRERGIDVETKMIRVGNKMVGQYSIPGETRPAESPRNHSKGDSHEDLGFPQASCGPAEMRRNYNLENLNLSASSEPGRLSPATQHPQGQRRAVVNPSMELRHEPRRADPVLFELAP